MRQEVPGRRPAADALHGTCSPQHRQCRSDELTLRPRPQGTLYSSCKKFDSSVDRNEPFEFQLGAGEVIKGWDNGLVGMCEGEKRKLTIPSDLGYGSAGAGADIHGGATLQFEVELLKVMRG